MKQLKVSNGDDPQAKDPLAVEPVILSPALDQNSGLNIRFMDLEAGYRVVMKAEDKGEDPRDYFKDVIRTIIDEPQKFAEEADHILSAGRMYEYFKANKPQMLPTVRITSRFFMEMYESMLKLKEGKPDFFRREPFREPQPRTVTQPRSGTAIGTKYLISSGNAE